MNDIITTTPVTIAGRDMVRLDVPDTHILHRIGSDSYSHIRHADVPAADVDNWEEIPVADIPTRTKAEYDAEVERLIARRYSYGKEIEVNRERDLHPDRYAAYLAYIDECKAEAKAKTGE